LGCTLASPDLMCVCVWMCAFLSSHGHAFKEHNSYPFPGPKMTFFCSVMDFKVNQILTSSLCVCVLSFPVMVMYLRIWLHISRSQNDLFAQLWTSKWTIFYLISCESEIFTWHAVDTKGLWTRRDNREIMRYVVFHFGVIRSWYSARNILLAYP
jgi:hypothetical protein